MLTKAGVTAAYSHNAFGQRVRKFDSTGPAKQVYERAAEENKLGLGDVAEAAMLEGLCGLAGVLLPW